MTTIYCRANISFEAPDHAIEKIFDKAFSFEVRDRIMIQTVSPGPAHGPYVIVEATYPEIADSYLWISDVVKKIEQYIKRFKNAEIL